MDEIIAAVEDYKAGILSEEEAVVVLRFLVEEEN